MRSAPNWAGPHRGKVRLEPIAVALRFIHLSTTFQKTLRWVAQPVIEWAVGGKKLHGEYHSVRIHERADTGVLVVGPHCFLREFGMRAEPNKRRAVAVFAGNHILDHFYEALGELGGPCPLYEAVVAHFPTGDHVLCDWRSGISHARGPICRGKHRDGVLACSYRYGTGSPHETLGRTVRFLSDCGGRRKHGHRRRASCAASEICKKEPVDSQAFRESEYWRYIHFKASDVQVTLRN